jgi:hypothetical protein
MQHLSKNFHEGCTRLEKQRHRKYWKSLTGLKHATGFHTRRTKELLKLNRNPFHSVHPVVCQICGKVKSPSITQYSDYISFSAATYFGPHGTAKLTELLNMGPYLV